MEGSGIDHVSICRSGDACAALLRRIGHGSLVTDVMWQGVKMGSGDYTRGASGFWIGNGVIRQPLQVFTIGGSLGEMFAGIQGSGTDVDRRGNIACGSLLLSPMQIAGA